MDPIVANFLVVGALALVIGGVTGAAWWWFRHRGVPQHEEFSEQDLRNLGDALGLDDYADRHYFGERVQVLSGHFERLYVELEISSGDWTPYVRVQVRFPSLLAQDITVLSEDPGTVVNKIRRLREIEVGDEEFDEEFLLFATREKRLKRFFPASTRFQMVRLNREVDELRLTDQSLFVFASRPCSTAEIRSLLKKTVELADRLMGTARELGPAPTVVDVTSYEESVEEKMTGSITELEKRGAREID